MSGHDVLQHCQCLSVVEQCCNNSIDHEHLSRLHCSVPLFSGRQTKASFLLQCRDDTIAGHFSRWNSRLVVGTREKHCGSVAAHTGQVEPPCGSRKQHCFSIMLQCCWHCVGLGWLTRVGMTSSPLRTSLFASMNSTMQPRLVEGEERISFEGRRGNMVIQNVPLPF